MIENGRFELGKLIFHAHLGRRHPVGASRTRSADQTGFGERASTAAKYSSVPAAQRCTAGFAHTQRA